MVDGHENEHLALPSQVRRKEETSASEQAADHQSHVLRLLLGNKSSTPSKFVSLLKLKDIAQHWQLAKEVFGAAHQSEYPQHQKQTLQDDTVDLSTDKADHKSLHLGYLLKPDQPTQPCEHKESSQYQLEAQTKNPEAPQIQSSLPEGEDPYRDSQPAEQVVPSLILHQEKLFSEEGLHRLSENPEINVPSLRGSATHLSRLTNSILRPGEIPKEPSPILYSASEKTQGPTVNELPVPMLGQYSTQHPTLSPVTTPPLDMWLSTSDKLTTEPAHSVGLQEVTPSPLKHPEVTLTHHRKVEAQQPKLTPVNIQAWNVEHTRTSPPTSGFLLSPTLSETPFQPPAPLLEALGQRRESSYRITPTLLALGPAQPPTLPTVMVQKLDTGPTLYPELTAEAEHPTAVQEVTVPPHKNPDVALAHPDQMHTQHPSLTPVIFKLSDVERSLPPPPVAGSQFPSTRPESPSQPPEPFMKAGDQHMVPAQMTNPTAPGQDTAQSPTLHSAVVQPMDMALIMNAKAIKNDEHSVGPQEVTASLLKHPEVTLAHPRKVEAPQPNLTPVNIQAWRVEHSRPSPPTSKVLHSPPLPENPSQPPTPFMEALGPDRVTPHRTTAAPLGQGPVQPPTLPSGTVQTMALMREKAIKEAGHFVAPEEGTVASLKDRDVRFPPSRQVESQGPTVFPAIIQPVKLDHPIPPSTSGTQLTPNLPENPSQPAEPSLKGVDQNTIPLEMINPKPPGQIPAQPHMLTSVMGQPLDMGRILHPEVTMEVEHSTTLLEDTAPQKKPEMTLAQPDQVQARQPNLTSSMVQLLHMEHSITQPPATETKLPSVMQVNPSQPPEPSMKAVNQHVVPLQTRNPTPLGQDTAKSPTFPTDVVHTMYMNLIMTSKGIAEAEHSVTLPEIEASPQQHPEVTLAHPDQVQAQQPNLTPITVQPLDVEQNTNHYSAQMVQDATSTSNICELCTCDNDTLSCTGLSPKQRLRQVPVVEVNSFTVLDFQGNSIYSIQKGAWKTYHWAEKL
ncbi:leucine-rich repeat-containing protein 37A2-like [Cavia porcellus]|uniref:leucine-rich repeat-containing protein 37A2-like n=1 Tax=Cavia porcellus TaxID=10141 RepID=UPI002FE1E1F7